MARIKPNTKIENGKVVFSKEVLDYFESIRTEENSEWINKYFEILSDASNVDSDKYRIHHIVPCFVFKDETHKNRQETEPLANKIKENKIRLSVGNHIKAHNCLWKIFNNWDSKMAVQKLCKMEKIEDLTEDDINKIAEILQECSKINQSEEEKKLIKKLWSEKNKDKLKRQWKEWRINNRDRIKANKMKRKEIISKNLKEWENNHKEERKIYNAKRAKRPCYDPIKHNICSYSTLKKRSQYHEEEYKDVNLRDCVIPNELIELVFILFNCFYS